MAICQTFCIIISVDGMSNYKEDRKSKKHGPSYNQIAFFPRQSMQFPEIFHDQFRARTQLNLFYQVDKLHQQRAHILSKMFFTSSKPLNLLWENVPSSISSLSRSSDFLFFQSIKEWEPETKKTESKNRLLRNSRVPSKLFSQCFNSSVYPIVKLEKKKQFKISARSDAEKLWKKWQLNWRIEQLKNVYPRSHSTWCIEHLTSETNLCDIPRAVICFSKWHQRHERNCVFLRYRKSVNADKNNVPDCTFLNVYFQAPCSISIAKSDTCFKFQPYLSWQEFRIKVVRIKLLQKDN